MDTTKFVMIGVSKEVHAELIRRKKLTGVPVYKQIELLLKKDKKNS